MLKIGYDKSTYPVFLRSLGGHFLTQAILWMGLIRINGD